MNIISNVLEKVLMFVLILVSIYYTFKLKFPQIKCIKYLFKTNDNNSSKLENSYSNTNSNTKKISKFNTLMSTLAGTLGIGNITGVALAIMLGGIGSIFWIFISGFFLQAVSYAENYIVLKYRYGSEKSGYYGGSMYVLRDVLKKPYLACAFAIMLVISSFGIGALIQSNSFVNVICVGKSIYFKYILAVISAIICGFVIFKGKYTLTRINSILIPISFCIYMFLCILVIVLNISKLPMAIKSIFEAAFCAKSCIVGGSIGSILEIIKVGFSKGVFSSEAGMGSTPIVAAMVEDVKDKNLHKTSYFLSSATLIDTSLMCTITGLSIVISNSYIYTDVITMLNATFGRVIFGKVLLAFCIVVFALATIPCWEYYGEQAICFLTDKKYLKVMYKLIYIFCIYIGSMASLNFVWDLSSVCNAIMVIPNIYMIYMLRNEVKIHEFEKKYN